MILVGIVAALIIGLIVAVVWPSRKQADIGTAVLDAPGTFNTLPHPYSKMRAGALHIPPKDAEMVDAVVLDFPIDHDFGTLVITTSGRISVLYSTGTGMQPLNDDQTAHAIAKQVLDTAANCASGHQSNHQIPLPETGDYALWMLTANTRKVTFLSPDRLTETTAPEVLCAQAGMKLIKHLAPA